MCDYSLHNVTSRPAKIDDKLVSTKFSCSTTRGFAAVGEPNVAVAYFPARKSHSSAKSNMSAGGGYFANTRFPKRKRAFGKSITKIKAYITTLWSFRMDRSCSFTACVRVST